MIVQYNKTKIVKMIGELYQYDYGQQLHIHGLDLPEVVEIGFSFTKTGGVDVPRFGITTDGVTTVTIPDLILEGNDSANNFYIYAFIFVEDEASGETTKTIELYVKSRPKRWMDNETGDTFSEVVKAVQELVDEYKKNGVSDEQVAQAVKAYLDKNGIEGISSAKIGEVTLTASAWTGENNLYSQIVTIEGVTENSQVDLTPSVEQLAIFYEKDLTFATENENGIVTVYAVGQKPTNDYTIQVTITEVEYE